MDLSKHGLKLRNEIDLVAADESRHIIWVVSVKDPMDSYASRRMGNICSEFFGDRDPQKNYQNKLRKMVEDIGHQKDAAAAWCGALRVDDWTVRGAFVTRTLCPAAFDTMGVHRTEVGELMVTGSAR